MGWREWFRGKDAAQALAPASSLALTAPTDALASLVFPDEWAADAPVTEEQALQVPATMRALTLIAYPISELPISNVPAWLTSSFAVGPVTLQNAIALTIKDMMLSPGGDALWVVDRSADGQIVRAWYARRDTWFADLDGTITVAGLKIPAQHCVYFSRGVPGLCRSARATIRQYLALSELISNAGDMPNPRAVLKETVHGNNMKPEQVDKALLDFATMLKARRGGIAYVPYGLEYATLDAASIPALTEARNAVRLDIANFVGLDPSMLAGATGSSNTYSNALQGDREFVQLTIKLFAAPIMNRLNQLDVRGTAPAMAFDYSSLEDLARTQSAGNTGNPREDPSDA